MANFDIPLWMRIRYVHVSSITDDEYKVEITKFKITDLIWRLQVANEIIMMIME